MSFDFHRLCHLEVDDLDDGLEIVNQYAADILAIFHRSEMGKKYDEIFKEEGGSWIEPLLYYSFESDIAPLPHMSAMDVRYLLEEIFPAKVSIEQDEAHEIIPEMIAFWQFVGSEFDKPDAKSILKYLQQVEKKYPKIIMDESKFGIGKTIVMAMIDEGMDFTDEKAMRAFIADYNQGILSDHEQSGRVQSTVSLEQKQEEYPFPVAELLTLGKPEMKADWTDYLKLGFSQDHISDLCRMVVDWELLWDDSDDELFWAPVHAWRILGVLQTGEATEPLISLLGFNDQYDSDWIGEEVPEVFGMIGPNAIPHLTKFLSEGDDKLWGRVSAAHSLEVIGNKYYHAKLECIDALTEQLKDFYDNHETLNGLLISYLLDLKGAGALPVIEEAYKAGMVDLTVCGDWEDVQVEFGLLKKRITPKSHHLLSDSGLFPPMPAASTKNKEQKKANAHANQQDQTGKQSRKKKRKRRRKKK